MKKHIEYTTPPDFVTVTALKTIDWIYNDSTQFIKGEVYTIPSGLHQSLAKYFVIKTEEKE